MQVLDDVSTSSASAHGPIVQLDRIWKSYGVVEVLTDVSLSVEPGEVVCMYHRSVRRRQIYPIALH